MEALDRLAHLDAVASRLKFALDDHHAANAAFAEWSARRDAQTLEIVEIWAYCFVQRHALVRFAREPRLGDGNDLDALISRTFLHVRAHLEEVRDPGRFSHWVAVVCRNGFLTYCRHRAQRPAAASLAVPADVSADDASEPLELDRAVVRSVVRTAIGRLPDTLRLVATMRLVEGRPYEEIAFITGHPQPTVRAYVSKAVSRLRSDPDLCALREELAGGIPTVARGRAA